MCGGGDDEDAARSRRLRRNDSVDLRRGPPSSWSNAERAFGQRVGQTRGLRKCADICGGSRVVTSAPWHGSVDGRRLPACVTGTKAAGCAFSRKRKRTRLDASAQRRLTAPIGSSPIVRNPFDRRNSGAGAWSAQIHRAALGDRFKACGAIDAVHIESAAGSEKTCACFAISGSFENSLETPDSFAWGAARAFRVGFEPTEEMAAAREQAPRWTFAKVAELRPDKGRRSLSRAEGRSARSATPRQSSDAPPKRVDQVLKERTGASED